jgi:hypothetical protein
MGCRGLVSAIPRRADGRLNPRRVAVRLLARAPVRRTPSQEPRICRRQTRISRLNSSSAFPIGKGRPRYALSRARFLARALPRASWDRRHGSRRTSGQLHPTTAAQTAAGFCVDLFACCWSSSSHISRPGWLVSTFSTRSTCGQRSSPSASCLSHSLVGRRDRMRRVPCSSASVCRSGWAALLTPSSVRKDV